MTKEQQKKFNKLKKKVISLLRNQGFTAEDKYISNTSMMFTSKEGADTLFLTIGYDDIELGYNNCYWWFKLDEFKDMLDLAYMMKEKHRETEIK